MKNITETRTEITATRLATRSSEPTSRRKLPSYTLSRATALAMLFGLATSARWIPPAEALPNGNGPTPQQEHTIECMGDVQATFTVTPSTVNLGQSATLSWKATIPSGCSSIGLRLDNLAVPNTGSRTIWPDANTSYTLRAVG